MRRSVGLAFAAFGILVLLWAPANAQKSKTSRESKTKPVPTMLHPNCYLEHGSANQVTVYCTVLVPNLCFGAGDPATEDGPPKPSDINKSEVGLRLNVHERQQNFCAQVVMSILYVRKDLKIDEAVKDVKVFTMRDGNVAGQATVSLKDAVPAGSTDEHTRDLFSPK